MPNANRSESAATKHHNRVAAIMMHTPRYSFRGTSRLAADAGVSKSTISHLVHGQSNPLYITVSKVVKVLETHVRKPLACREVVSETGTYPTQFVCELVGCPGCLPDIVFELDGHRKEAYRHLVPGTWTGDTAEFHIDGPHKKKGRR